MKAFKEKKVNGKNPKGEEESRKITKLRGQKENKRNDGKIRTALLWGGIGRGRGRGKK